MGGNQYPNVGFQPLGEHPYLMVLITNNKENQPNYAREVLLILQNSVVTLLEPLKLTL